MLWHESVIGWGNLAVAGGRLSASFGYAAGRAPRSAAYRTGLEAELDRMCAFLDLTAEPAQPHPRQVRNAPVSRCTKSDWR